MEEGFIIENYGDILFLTPPTYRTPAGSNKIRSLEPVASAKRSSVGVEGLPGAFQAAITFVWSACVQHRFLRQAGAARAAIMTESIQNRPIITHLPILTNPRKGRRLTAGGNPWCR